MNVQILYSTDNARVNNDCASLKRKRSRSRSDITYNNSLLHLAKQ